jgi:uncharacterized protein YeeX (DUF496 family)
MSVLKTTYYCPFCNIVMTCTATNIVRHCKSRHGKVVKADDYRTPPVVKAAEWSQERRQLADKFKKGK